MSKAIPYRPEVDGLRTIAILPVLLFHLGFTWIEGGFLGVDVFFVISGYLITSIIIKESAQKKFTFRGFWMRRIRRIFPVLSIMVWVTLVVAFFISFRPELRNYGHIAIAALLSVANVVILRESGSYWGPEAEDSPFLHTWSLSVEEQFYLLYPLVLVAIFKKKREYLGGLIGVCCLAGFILFVIASSIAPNACFYLLPTRAWELGTGCFVAVLHAQNKLALSVRTGGLLSGVGMALILISYFFISGEDGVSATQGAAVVGAAFIVANQQPHGLVYRILAWGPMVFIGKLSYSLYVWHWPVIVLGKPYFEAKWAFLGVGPALTITVILSLLSYFFIEKKTRQMKRIGTFVVANSLLALTVASFLIWGSYSTTYDTSKFKKSSYYGQLYDLSPLNPPLSKDVNLKRRGILAPPRDYDAIKDVFATGGINAGRENAPFQILLFGDSHALMWSRTLSELGEELGVKVVLNGMSATTPFFEIPVNRKQPKTSRYDGKDKTKFDLSRLELLTADNTKLLMIASRWSQRRTEETTSLLDYAASRDLPVLLIEQPPEIFIGNNNASQYIAFLNLKTSEEGVQAIPMGNIEQYRKGKELLVSLEQKYENVSVCTLSKELLTEGNLVRVVKNREILYYDDDHLSNEGTTFLKPVLKEAIQKALGSF